MQGGMPLDLDEDYYLGKGVTLLGARLIMGLR